MSRCCFAACRLQPIFARLTFCAFLLAPSSFTARQADGSPPPSIRRSVDGSPVEFSPGIRIDWSRREVLLDGEVVLREGPLELFACSPMTREHESILAVRGRPRDVHQALGLLGFEPGRPVHYNPQLDRLMPATGHELAVSVRCQAEGHERPVPVNQWLLRNDTEEPVDDLTWVFAGSTTLPNGRYAADMEGTVLCVVNFNTALIALPNLHTADNELLWVSANPRRVPPIGTKCELIIRSTEAGRSVLVVRVEPGGELHLEGKPTSAAELKRRFDEAGDAAALLRLVPSPALAERPDSDQRAVLNRANRQLVEAGLDPEKIDLATPDIEKKGD